MNIDGAIDFFGTFCLRFECNYSYVFIDVTFPRGFSFGELDGHLIPLLDNFPCCPVIPNVSHHFSHEIPYICLDNYDNFELKDLVDLFVTSRFNGSIACISRVMEICNDLGTRHLANRSKFNDRFNKLIKDLMNIYNSRMCIPELQEAMYHKLLDDIKSNSEIMIVKLPQKHRKVMTDEDRKSC